MAKFRSKLNRDWRFAKVDLTKDQKEAFPEWSNALNEDVIEVLGTVLLDGYKFSLKYDPDNDAWIATLTGSEGMRTNSMTSMSGRHKTAYDATVLVLYKHLEVCTGGNWSEAAEDSEWG